MAAGMTTAFWSRAFWMLTLLWVFVALPVAFLAVTLLEGTLLDLRLSASGTSFPLLTQWYAALGAGGLYSSAAAPGLLAVVLAPFRKHLAATIAMSIALVTCVYISMFGMVAANIAYVKLCT